MPNIIFNKLGSIPVQLWRPAILSYLHDYDMTRNNSREPKYNYDHGYKIDIHTNLVINLPIECVARFHRKFTFIMVRVPVRNTLFANRRLQYQKSQFN